jgi:CheY-like chemotaxis protein
MANAYKHSILIVDDDEDVREILESLLTAEGYAATTAEHGLQALSHLNTAIPDVIISDLQMPQMSGFEFLSVVRRRFPQVSVIASSGAYMGDEIPSGVMADAFHAKGNSLNSLLRTISALIRTASVRASEHAQQPSPTWVPRTGKDSSGVPYIVLTCNDCLRSFPLAVSQEPTAELLSTPCIFCPNIVTYIIDFSRSISSSAKSVGNTLALSSSQNAS